MLSARMESFTVISPPVGSGMSVPEEPLPSARPSVTAAALKS